MTTRATTIEITEGEWLRKLSEYRPEVELPGFWATLAENCATWASEVSAGPFWTSAKERLDHWRTEYRQATGADLLPAPGLPGFVSKSEASIKDKLYRRSKEDERFLDNAIAKDGPPVPGLDDLVRTRIACRYVDGVEFLANKLFDLGTEKELTPRRERKGLIVGYFAQHLTFSQHVVFRMANQGKLAVVRCEAQIATEMATRMWDAAHPLYERSRGKAPNPEDWQWKPDDPLFISNQLGHMIHLADGLLVQLRKSISTRKA